jgi:hypothetical protein
MEVAVLQFVDWPKTVAAKQVVKRKDSSCGSKCLLIQDLIQLFGLSLPSPTIRLKAHPVPAGA